MASPLFDLDELVLRCRDKSAQNYIKEAVTCYKAGAIRSAIVSTWIAVTFDFIDKIKDLSLSGEKEALLQLQLLENALNAGDINLLLKFEREMLIVARDKLELISHVEFVDLQRLQEDRNRCAHPSMKSDGQIFNPPAELARLHIRSAIECLLQHPPAQGKSALNILLKEVDSSYFPIDVDSAVVALKNSPLKKARESLVRNFVIVLLKNVLSDNKDVKSIRRIYSALAAVKTMYKEFYDVILDEKLSVLIKNLDDSNLSKTFSILENLVGSWDVLDADVKLKLASYVRNLPSGLLEELEFLLGHAGLSPAAKERVGKITREELNNSNFFILPDEISEKIVSLYVNSTSFEKANNFATIVVSYALDFSKEQVERLIKACGTNYEIKASFEVVKVINALRKNRMVTDRAVDDWLEEVGLDEYASNYLDHDMPF